MIHVLACGTRPIRAAAKTAVFMLKLLPMLPSSALDWITPAPVVERVRYPTSAGLVDGDLYRPATDGPHPGVVVCLGVVPFGIAHPQVPRLGAALARSGFAALLYWCTTRRRMAAAERSRARRPRSMTPRSATQCRPVHVNGPAPQHDCPVSVPRRLVAAWSGSMVYAGITGGVLVLLLRRSHLLH